MTETIDYLDEDYITIPGQKYALISVVSPESRQKNDICGVKIRGVFSELELAQQHAQKLQKVDTTFNIYLVEMYKWLPIPPDDDNIDNHEFMEQKLNDIVKGHKEQQILSKQFFEERKMEQMEDAMNKVKEAEELQKQQAESSSSEQTEQQSDITEKEQQSDIIEEGKEQQSEQESEMTEEEKEQYEKERQRKGKIFL